MGFFVPGETTNFAFGNFTWVPGCTRKAAAKVRVVVEPGDPAVTLTYVDSLAVVPLGGAIPIAHQIDNNPQVAGGVVNLAAPGTYDVQFILSWAPPSVGSIAGAVEVHASGGFVASESPGVTGDAQSRQPLHLSMVLDRSGSMGSNVTAVVNKLAALKLAVKQSLPLYLPQDQVACVAFDCTVSEPFQLAPVNVGSMSTSIDSISLGGATAIGDGLALGRTRVAANPLRAVLLATDGMENCGTLFLNPGPGQQQLPVDTGCKTFVIGIGTGADVDTARLQGFCAASAQGSYFALTGSPNDPQFMDGLSKFFCAMVADATNTQPAMDPTGTLAPGAERVHAFNVTDADFRIDAVTLIQADDFAIALETPDGHFIHSGTPGVDFVQTPVTTLLRVWVGKLDSKKFPKLAGTWKAHVVRRPRDWSAVSKELGKKLEKYGPGEGAHYQFFVNVESDLRLNAQVWQASTDPGATIRLSATVTEGTIAIGGASVRVDVRYPNGTTSPITLKETATKGQYEATLAGSMIGTYGLHFVATGKSLAGAVFRRETQRSASIGPVGKGGPAENGGPGNTGGGTSGSGTTGSGSTGGSTGGDPHRCCCFHNHGHCHGHHDHGHRDHCHCQHHAKRCGCGDR